MSEVDEHIIEVWVRNPDSLSARVRQEVERRIAQFPEWRETAEYWKEYYGTLAEVEAEGVPEQGETVRYSLSAVKLPQVSSPTRSLAAKDAGSEQALEELVSFLHEDPEILVRFLLDRDRGQVLIRAVAREGALASIEIPGVDQPVPLNARGQATLEASAKILEALEKSASALSVEYRA
ncbi:MAG: hypothetical protein HKN29_14260 [Rhodothermales bacterium]|nr:hypothetical protein [Rhodothermales bacterium]